jgi:hypothetical protein
MNQILAILKEREMREKKKAEPQAKANVGSPRAA